MKKLIFVCFFVFSFSLTCFAADFTPTQIQLGEELLQAMNLPQVLKKTREDILAMELQANPSLVPYAHVYYSFLEKYMGYDVLKNDIRDIYLSIFSEGELKEIVTFYKTETGQKLLRVSPELMRKGSELGMKNLQAHIQELYTMLAQEQKKAAETQNTKNAATIEPANTPADAPETAPKK
jgi:uncharacterized protein